MMLKQLLLWMYLYGLSLQIVTAGNGKEVLNLESTLTFLGYDNRYINFWATRNANNELASMSISNQIHLETHPYRNCATTNCETADG